MAEGGTLFLDEIGEIPMHLQSKLLGVLEDHKVRRLGGEIFQPVDVRIIAATSQSLETMLGKSFRSDLYYRLSVIRVHLPPLRERRQDIPDLCRTLLGKLLISGMKPVLPESEMQALMNYDWPGNIRELRNILERSMIHRKGEDLKPSEFLIKPDRGPQPTNETEPSSTIQSLAELEKKHVQMTLEKLGGNYTQVAKVLGIALSTLKRKLHEYGLR
jgi:transcriptional regulator with PAS, ATPase and Fis domain